MKKILEKISVIAPFALLLPAFAMAQTPQSPPDVLQNGIGGVGSTLCTIFNWMFYFLIILAIIFVVIAAFRYLFAAGDPEKVKAAGHALIYAAVAIAVGLIAKAVPSIVGTLLGSGTITGC
jgi:uncharacterized membrane protein